MGKTNFRRMMMLREHDKNREPERDRLEEERDRRERIRCRAIPTLTGMIVECLASAFLRRTAGTTLPGSMSTGVHLAKL